MMFPVRVDAAQALLRRRANLLMTFGAGTKLAGIFRARISP